MSTFYEKPGNKNITVIEMAIMEYGSIEGIPYIIEDNFLEADNFLSDLIEDTSGKTLLIRNDNVINLGVKTWLQKNFPNIGNDMQFVIID